MERKKQERLVGGKDTALVSLKQLTSPTSQDHRDENNAKREEHLNGNGPGRPRGPQGPRVSWTPKEEDDLVAESLKRWRKVPENGIGLALVNAAQCAILSIDRQRTLYTTGTCENIITRTTDAAKQILDEQATAAAPQVRTIVVDKVQEPAEVLKNMPLSQLIGIVESRRYEELRGHQRNMESIAATGKIDKLHVGHNTAEILASHGLKEVKDVRTKYPMVCLVGVSQFELQQMTEQLQRVPVNLFFSTGSNDTPAAHSLPLASDCYFAVNKAQCPDGWAGLISHLVERGTIKATKYVHGATMERLRSNLSEIGAQWLKDNPQLATFHAQRFQ